MLTTRNPSTIAPPAAMYSHSVEVPANARWLVTAGQVGTAPDGSVPEGFEAQHDQIWQNTLGGQVSGPATVIGNVAYVSTFSGNATVGFNIKTGKRVFKLDEGEYGPVVSDGRRMYLVGAKTIIALKPISRKNTSSSNKDNSKGVVPGRPKEIKAPRADRN